VSSPPYTSNCDLYFAIYDGAIDGMMARLMRFLPSFFNYTDAGSFNPAIACTEITPDPSVTARGDPLLSQISLPAAVYQPFTVYFPQTSIPLTPLTIQPPRPLNFVLQLTNFKVDFYPGGNVSLPATLPRPLPSQNMAFEADASLGLSCPSQDKLECVSLDFFTEMTLKTTPSPFLSVKMNAMDLVGLEPDGLRELIDCYTMYFVNQLLAWASLQVDNLLANPLPISLLGGVIKELQVSPAIIPNQSNPAVQNDQLAIFMDVVDFELNSLIGVTSGPSQAGSNQPSTPLPVASSRSIRTRTGTGPYGVTLAISSKTFGKILGDVIASGTILEVPGPSSPPPPGQPFSTQPWAQYGSSPIYLQYKIGASVAGGSISLQNPSGGQPNGTIQVNNLQILWNELKFQIVIDLPQITVGAIHTSAVTIPTPWGPVTIIPAIDFPGITLFGGGDIQIPIDLSPLNLVSEATMTAEPVVYYGIGNPGSQQYDPNRWEFYVVPQLPIFVWPVFSFNLTSAITSGINQFFNNLFGQYPGPVVDAIKDALEAALTGIFGVLSSIFSDLATVVQTIVDMILNDAPGIKAALDQLLLDFFTGQAPLFQLPDPLIGPSPTAQNWGPNPVANLTGGSRIGPPVVYLPIPLPYIGVTVNSNEVVVEGDIGP